MKMIIDNDELYPYWFMNEATEHDLTAKYPMGVIRNIPADVVEQYQAIQVLFQAMQDNIAQWRYREYPLPGAPNGTI